ncbi:MAG: hypothetical protein IJX29_01960 [Bacteroides sp.]|nr:hypothetical protein [Bacteroides sp.]
MSTNNSFSFSRLGLVMKRDLMENWKKNLYRFLGPYAGFLMVILFCYMIECDFFSFKITMLSAFTLILVFGGAYTASSILENMNTQQKRVSFLMLPATSLEKFITRAMYVTLGFALTIIIALLLAEATRFLFLPLFNLPEEYHQSVLPFMWDELMRVETMKFVGEGAEESYAIGCMGVILSWLLLFWAHSFFILGGCYWQKHPFWKTLGIILLVNHIIGLLLILLVQSLEDVNWNIDGEWLEAHLSWITVEGIMSFFIVLFTCLLALNWWLSYRCFTRSQVIKPKFRLL